MKLHLLAASTAIALAGCSFFGAGGDYMSSYAPSSASQSVYSGGTYSGCGEAAYTSYYGQNSGCMATQPAPTYQQASCGSPCGTVPIVETYVQAPQPSSPCATAQPAQVAYAPAPAPCSSYAVSAAQPTTGAYYGASNYGSGHGGGYYHNDRGPAYHMGKPAFTHSQTGSYLYGELGVNGIYGIKDIDPIFGAVGRLGYNSRHNFGVEVEGLKGLRGSDGLVNVPAMPAMPGPPATPATPASVEDGTYRLDRSLGAFGVVRFPLGEVTGLLRGGYHETTFEAEVKSPAFETEFKEKGYAVGAGIEMPLSNAGAIRADTTYYDMGDAESFWSTALTYQQKF